MATEMETDISTRISILRIVMIFGIVILHTPLFVPIEQVGTSPFDLIKAFFQSAVFRCTVPVLTLISGYLLFGSGIDTRPKAVISKKFKSLVVPLLVFNLPLVIVVYLLQSHGTFAISYQLVPAKLSTLADATFAWSAAPLNYPLYFLRDLFVLCALSPIFGWFLRRAALCGMVLVAVVFLMDLDSGLILRRAMPLTFYLGGYCAVHKVDVRCLDKYAGACLALFVLFCAAVVAFKVQNTTSLRLIAPLLIWPAGSLLVGTRFGTWAAGKAKYSFFIFLSHAPILMLTWMIYSKYFSYVPYPIYWLTAPVLTAAFLIGLYRVCVRYIPVPFAWARGVKAPRAGAGPVSGNAVLHR